MTASTSVRNLNLPAGAVQAIEELQRAVRKGGADGASRGEVFLYGQAATGAGLTRLADAGDISYFLLDVPGTVAQGARAIVTGIKASASSSFFVSAELFVDVPTNTTGTTDGQVGKALILVKVIQYGGATITAIDWALER